MGPDLAHLRLKGQAWMHQATSPSPYPERELIEPAGSLTQRLLSTGSLMTHDPTVAAL